MGATIPVYEHVDGRGFIRLKTDDKRVPIAAPRI